MFSKLLSLGLCLGLGLIALCAQLATARPQNPYYVESSRSGEGGYGQSSRHQHHSHGRGHGSGPGFSGGYGPPQQPGFGGRFPQPSPHYDPYNQQPGSPFRGQQPGGFRPHPGQGGRHRGGDFHRGQNGYQQPGGYQPGQGQGGFQQPGEGGFQQPGQGQGGFQEPGQGRGGFQRPGEGGFRQPVAKQPDSPGNSHPDQDEGFQKPQPGSGGNPIQPRPGTDGEDFSQFHFQTPNTVQPRPGQGQEQSGHGGSTIQPRPGGGSSPTDDGDALKDIFNTHDFLSPSLNQGGGHRDPKSETEDAVPSSVNQRNLFNTDPICTDGTVLMAGRCRKAA
ncbi:glutenin, high molecular weight subunit PW212 isoform X2 [Drosophila pseudoobscura]|uniref:Glutenin, high molecular weight subunit PW212 isoform X2 n=1 Tax=Drosophila pseudoobscura pseudoobscura TaxID=46245 RepID=A0A6I8VS57_DROPS|nr:glutenin, high molecular weight subunit PW212 isoform X2 [Drosophila pseudoobscura]